MAVGAPIIATPIIAWLISSLGWRGSFFSLGAIGLIPIAFLGYYLYNTPKEHPRISKEELVYIEANTENREENVVTEGTWVPKLIFAVKW